MAVRDFDAERKVKYASADHARFTLGGHLFTCRRKINPDVFTRWVTLRDAPDEQGVSILDSIMLDVIQPSDADAWAAVRSVTEPEEMVIDLHDMMQVLSWIIEEVVSTPLESLGVSTGQSEATPTGQNGSGTTPVSLPASSTPDVSSAEPVASTTST